MTVCGYARMFSQSKKEIGEENMGSIARIPKDQILEAALRMLIRDGYESINIKTLAKELGCSTQPISWHFGSMPNLRKELTEAAFQYAAKEMLPSEDIVAVDRFRGMGCRYIDFAFDKPNLARFLTEAHEGHTFAEQFVILMDHSLDENMARQIADIMSISVDDADKFIQTMMMYVHGFVTMILSGKAPTESKEEAHMMVERVGGTFMRGLGAKFDRLREFREADLKKYN